jgi:putative ABC transport system permease protein
MAFLRRLINLFYPSPTQRDIDEELRSHLEMRREDNLAAGMNAAEAHRDAVLRFGNPTTISERVLAADAPLGLASAWADLRFAFRQLRRSPGFAATSILVLGGAIGCSTAIFSAIKPILIDSLPYPEPARLMVLWEMQPSGAPMNVTFGTFHGLAERSHSFEALAVVKEWQPAITGAEMPERLDGQRVSAAYFKVLGVAPLLGHDFDASDDRLRGPATVILSDALWDRRFGRDPAIIGQQIRLDDNLFTVIGVMPRGFRNTLTPDAELWTLLQYDSALPADGREWGHHLRLIGRLRAGVTREQATSQLNSILPVLARQFAPGYDSSGGAPKGIFVNPMQHDLTEAVRPALLEVSGAVALILVIACVNVTNLLLARAAQRRTEFSIRAALGAAQSRLVRQLLTESLLLSLFGGALGLAIAAGGVKALVALSPPNLPRPSADHLSAGALLFAFGITTLIGVVVGIVPALDAIRAGLQASLQHNSRSTVGSHRWVRRTLVVAQVSLAFVLLISAGLLMRSMRRLLAIDPGFDSFNVLTMQIQETGHRFDSDAARIAFFSDALDTVRRIPGVVSAGLTSQLPLTSDFDEYGVEVERENNPRGDDALRYSVSPGYIETMRIPLRRGRLLTEHDDKGAPTAVLINEAFARHRFAGVDPIGQRIRVGPDVGHADRPGATVVGVVGNTKQQSLAVDDVDAFFLPTTQWSWADNVLSLVVRTQSDPAQLAPAIRSAIWSIDKDQPIVRVATMENLVAESAAQRRFILVLFEIFGATALALATIGIYGILSGSVTERRREMGVRAALGASRGSILTLILRQGMALVFLGVVIGLAGALATSRTISTLLFGISRLDVPTYLAVIALLAVVSAIACLIPAIRAASANPVEALRAD